MNRRTELFDNRVADWLEDDPVLAPPQLLETVLAAVPSIPQRRGGVAWPQRALSMPWQFAAAVIAVVVVSVLGLLILRGPSVGPKPSPTTNTPGLPMRVDVPLRFYSINLPAGSLQSVVTGTTGVDTFNADEGRLDVRFALLPANTGQDAWADAYFVEQMGETGGCAGLDPGTWDQIRVGQETGRIYALNCLPGWMVLLAIGDRGYDIRFTVRGGQDATRARAVFDEILLALSFQQGATPPLALSTFTSSRYGFSIGYPTGWKITESTAALGEKDIPWARGNQVDLIEGPDSGSSPGQPTTGTLDLASVALTPGTTLQAFTANTAGLTCGNGAGTPITVDGETGNIVEYGGCNGDFHQWVTVIHQGRGYHILWLNVPVSKDYDRLVFRQILPTFRFPVAGQTSPPSSPAGS